MTSKAIQEQFGQKIIESFAEFARHDLQDIPTLEASTFNHVADARLRRELAQVLYGARWIYKLGLALLTSNEERAAHVRAQIVDYAAVSEALLSYCISHAIRRGHTVGVGYTFDQPDTSQRPLVWNVANPDPMIAKRTMWWLAKIAAQFQIITPALETELQWLREQRNTVHIRARVALGATAFLNQSKRAFEATLDTVTRTKTWMAGHP